MDDNYIELANAIILQAVKDYRGALKALKNRPRSETAKISKQEVERFFRSDWYLQLTSLDPEMLMQKLKEEVSA